MSQIDDLKLVEEVIPVFDYTHNQFAKKKLVEIISKPLNSENKIYLRQNILKGLISNNNILSNYGYSAADLIEIYHFMRNLNSDFSKKKLFFFRKKKIYQSYKSKFIQFVLFFNRIKNLFIDRISLDAFPAEYKEELEKIKIFLNCYNLPFYEKIIHENKFKVSQVIMLLRNADNNLDIHQFWELFFKFEAYLSISLAIVRRGFVFPHFSDGYPTIENLYHPLLSHPVKNTIKIEENIIIVNGANMAGKSTFLRALSLCFYLGNIGLAVPAQKAILPRIDDFFIFLDHKDNINKGYSHFMQELMNLKDVLIEARNHKKCFVVFDELFTSTNYEDAFELTKSTIRGLRNFKDSIFIISTHINKVKEIDDVKRNLVQSIFFQCNLNADGAPVFNYKLEYGWSELQIGKILYEKTGILKLLSQDMHSID